MSSYRHMTQHTESSVPSRYSATSPNANSDEDWTKITDLAERRRIQNRIAQRNYRKKLKRRLEDLDKRATSSSASPEQQPAVLYTPDQSRRHGAASSIERRRRSSDQRQHQNHTRQQDQGQEHIPDFSTHNYTQPDERDMFSQQATRQLSISPAPSTFDTMPLGSTSLQQPSYYMPTTIYDYQPPSERQLYASSTSTYPQERHHLKMESFANDELSPFSMSYASLTNLDLDCQQYSETPYTPPLLEPLDFGYPDTPPESLYGPRTPTAVSQTLLYL